MAITTPPLKMNMVIEFYKCFRGAIHTEQGWIKEGKTPPNKNSILRAAFIRYSCPGLSWKPSLDSIDLVMQGFFANPETAESARRAKNDFLLCAFKDLSVIKDPLAMEVFRQLNLEGSVGGGIKASYIWARRTHKRQDGSAVLVLHVSDLERIKKMIHDEANSRSEIHHGSEEICTDIEDGVIVY